MNETVDKRKEVPSRLTSLAKSWGARHVFCNIEYEVGELRREERPVKMSLNKGIAFEAVHDNVVVPPGAPQTSDLVGAGSIWSSWLD